MIYEFQVYKWSKRRGTNAYGDKPQDRDDHHMDGLNGLMASRPAASPPGIMGHPYDLDDIERQLEESMSEFEEKELTHMSD